jgi:nicotinic acid mononucleotide adenylyltransferase
MIGCFPGSFHPITVAHLGVSLAAVEQCGLLRLDLVISETALGKSTRGVPSASQRAARSRQALEAHPSLASVCRVVVTPHQLLADIAQGYDWLVLGEDKWAQIAEPRWYGDSPAARDAALALLPRVALAPRPGSTSGTASPGTASSHTQDTDWVRPLGHTDTSGLVVLAIDPALAPVSSTQVRAGRRDWAAPLSPSSSPRPDYRPSN